jgi:predicted RNA-binding Zn ribbon-like protein
MTGKDVRAPQPGNRPPAPGRLAVVQSFINTHYDLEVDHGADLFATAEELRRWLTRNRLLDRASTAIAEPDRLRAISVREALRELARANGGATVVATDRLNRAADGAAVNIRFTSGGPRFEPTKPGLGGALSLILASAAAAMFEGSWSRLKICPGDDCGWAFYDHSRNRSGRWCSMSVCGGRAKVRAHYRRTRGVTLR